MITRREPLLWLQLMAVAVIPLELELLRLLLAGPALGPAPALERLLIWGLAVIGPGLLLWRRPADWGSMLLVRLPLPGRSSDQRRISALPQTLGLKAALVMGMALLLLGFWSIDRSALLVTQMSPLANGSRLTALLLAGPLLTVMLWQWQQLCQAIWLLTRSDQAFENLQPISEAELQDRTLSFGLNVLELPALEWPAPKASATTPTPTVADREEPMADASEAETAPKTELADTAEDSEADDPETSASASTKDDEPAFTATEDSSSSSEAAAEADNAEPDPSEPDERETEETDTDDAEAEPDVMPELFDSAGDPEAEDPETSASASTKDDEPAFTATEDSSSSSEAGAEPENADPDPDPSEPNEPEAQQTKAEEPEADVPEADAEVTSEPSDTADNAESLPSAVSGSIEPKQGAEDDDGPDLDGEVTDHDLIPGGEAEGHHKQT